MLGLIRLTALAFTAINLAAVLFALMIFAIKAAPPSSAIYAICPYASTPNPPLRIIPGGSDSVEPFWWSSGGMNVIAGAGVGTLWKTTKADYQTLTSPPSPPVSSFTALTGAPASGFTSYAWNFGTNTHRVNDSDVVGSTNWYHSQHAWPSGIVSVPDPTTSAPTLFAFYHNERGECLTPNTTSPTTCTSIGYSGNDGQGLCYYDKYSTLYNDTATGTSLPDPGAGTGYQTRKVSGRIGLSVSTDDGETWLDKGWVVNPSLQPPLCTPDTSNQLAGGVRGPKPVLDPDGYVYVFFMNVGGDPAAPAAIKNQGILVTRIKADATGLFSATPLNQFRMWDGSGWNFNPNTATTADRTNYWTNVQPLNNMKAVASWYTSANFPATVPGGCDGGTLGCHGNFGWPDTAWNTVLGTYTMFLTNFTQANQYNDNQPVIFYFKGASLATDPLNWVAFEHWIEPGGTVQVPGAPGSGPPGHDGMSLVNYKDFSWNDYYFGLVGTATSPNPGCVGRGGGGSGQETDKCMGRYADIISKYHWDVAGGNLYPFTNRTSTGAVGNTNSQPVYPSSFLRFEKNQSTLQCNDPLPVDTSLPGGGGGGLLRRWR